MRAGWELWGPGLAVVLLGLGAAAVLLLLLGRKGGASGTLSSADRELRITDLRRRRDELYESLNDPTLADSEKLIMELAAARVLRDLDELGALDPTPAAPDAVPEKTAAPVDVPRPAASGAQGGRSAAAGGTWISRHPLLAGTLFGAGMTALVGALILLVMRDATPRQDDSMARPAPMQDPAPNDPGLPPAEQQRLRSILQKAMDDPTDADAANAASHALLEAGMFVEAFSFAKQALEARPGDPEATAHEAMVRIVMGQSELAATMLDKVIAEHPTEGEAHLYRGMLYVREGDREAGIKAWTDGAAASADNADRLLALAEDARNFRLPSDRRGPGPEGSPPPPGGGSPDGAAPAAGASAGPSYSVTISLAEGLSPPSGAVLFVYLRSPGQTAGPPAAVKRVAAASFPLTVTLTPADSMMGMPIPERALVQARLDADGNVSTKSPSDPSAETEADAGAVSLTLR